MDFNFRDQVTTNSLTSNLTAFAFFVVDTNIYSNNVPGYFGQTMSNNVSGMVTNLPALPTARPRPGSLPTASPTLAWTNDETLDTDGDGMLNWQEYQANTNPKDPTRSSRCSASASLRTTADGRSHSSRP